MIADVRTYNMDKGCRYMEKIKDYIISDDKYTIFHFPRKILTLNRQYLLEAIEPKKQWENQDN
jgi:hypothetical protein